MNANTTRVQVSMNCFSNPLFLSYGRLLAGPSGVSSTRGRLFTIPFSSLNTRLFQKKYDAYRRQIDRCLLQLIDGQDSGSIYEPMRYVLASGGKRLRATLVLLACDAVGGRSRAAVDAAAAIEILHNFTLVHDDIMDRAALRRGKPTIHRKWDQNTAILTGDEMIAHAYNIILNTRSEHFTNILQRFTTAFVEVCEGQALDKAFESRNDVALSEYLLMIKKKTSRLISAATEIGALIGGGSERMVKALRVFGERLGMAFQIQDDLLDITGSTRKFGKTIGGDIFEGKKTFLLLTALEASRGNDRKTLMKVVHRSVTREMIPVVREIYDRSGALASARSEIGRQTRLAQQALRPIRRSTARDTLMWLSQQLLERNS